MLRVVLTILIPLLLPAFVHWLWFRLIERRRLAALTDGTLPVQPWWVTAPWLTLVIAGVVLAGATLAFTALNSGAAPHSSYRPAQVEGGRLVPGQQTP